MRAGARLVAASGIFWVVATVTGLQPGWRTGVFLFLFLGGVIDIAIAADLIARGGGNPAEELAGRTRGAVAGMAVAWRGGAARDGRPPGQVLSQTDSVWGSGLYAPPPGHWESTRSMAEWADSTARVPDAIARYQAPMPEKRLAYREAGIDFPVRGGYVTADRRGRPTPPFPVHYRTSESALRHLLAAQRELGELIRALQAESAGRQAARDVMETERWQ